MTNRVQELVSRIHTLELELEEELKLHPNDLASDFDKKRIRYEQEVLAQQKNSKWDCLSIYGLQILNLIFLPLSYIL